MKYTIAILGLVLFSFPITVLAECRADGYTVVYVNGIKTDQNAAGQDKKFFEEKYKSISQRHLGVSFTLGYNPTHGVTSDLAKSVIQSYEPAVLEDLDLQAILKNLHNTIHTRRVLLVGHSQGTFYTNAIRSFLVSRGMEESAVAVYNLATPASYVAGGGMYLTSSNDRLINTVRSAQHGWGALEALPANTTLPMPPEEKGDTEAGGHYFRSDYLAYADSRIIRDMDFALKALASSKPSDDGGCFTLPEFKARAAVLNTVKASASGTLNIAAAALYNGVAAAARAASSAALAIGSKTSSVIAVLMGGNKVAAQASAPVAVVPQPILSSAVAGPTPPPVPPKAPTLKVALAPVPATLPPAPTPQKTEDTPPAPVPPQEPLIPFAPFFVLPAGVSPGFGGGGAPPPAQESPPAEEESAPLPESPDDPTITLLTPDDGALFGTTTVSVSGTTTPATEVTIAWGLAGQDDTDTATATSDEAGDWSLAVLLAEGESAIAAGVFSTTSGATSTASRTVVVDTTPPSPPALSISHCRTDLLPLPDCLISATTTAEASWLAVEEAAGYVVTVDGIPATTTERSSSIPLSLQGATSTVAITAYDTAGNTSHSESLFAAFISLVSASLTPMPPFIARGGTVSLAWSVSDAIPNSCSLTEEGSDWSVSLDHAAGDSGATSSPAIIIPTTFTLSCAGAGGFVASSTVMVGLLPDIQEI